MRDVYQISPRKPIEGSVQLAFYINIHIQSDEYASWAKKTTSSCDYSLADSTLLIEV